MMPSNWIAKYMGADSTTRAGLSGGTWRTAEEPISTTKRSLLRRYGMAVIVTVLMTLVEMLLDPVLGKTVPFVSYVYFVAVMVAAWYGGLGPSLLALVSGAMLTAYFFAEPSGSLLIHDLDHQVTLALYVFAGLVVGILSESLRESRHRSEAAQAELASANRALQEEIAIRQEVEADLRAARDSAERAKDSAEKANRAKDHFLAVLSHELRTPLTPVGLGVSMLQDRPDLAPEVRETLDMIGRNVEMEARLIDDLLDVARISRGKVELKRFPVELCTVIRQAVEVCKLDIAARRLDFGVDMGPAAACWVDADAARLQQVLWNLLKNAIKFTPHGGCVGIRCRRDGDLVIVEVNDSGIGIEPEALSRVFNAFEQAEQSITRQFGGLGLGLAISKALVEMHGGTISAHSEGRDKGATFQVRLPLTVPATGLSDAPAPVAVSRRAPHPLRILLVEDHGVTAKMMRMVLAAEGHAVETAGDLATALESAGRHTFDLLLSDLGLPDGSGHELMRQLRDRGHNFPGIALSGYGQEEDIQRSGEAGFAAHLTKPASREAVVEAIASVIATAATIAEAIPGSVGSSQPEVPAVDANVLDQQGTIQRCLDREKAFPTVVRAR